MKTLLLFILMALATTAVADAGSCYGIDNADARSYCLARAHQDSGACYTIQSSDLRAMCLAEVRK